jgi:Cdc6-like AAA superfamily ATPase
VNNNELEALDKAQREIEGQLAEIYTPSTPITEERLFSGRAQLLYSLGAQLEIPGTVFILYGDRGVGKTSFYNVLLNSHNKKTIRYSCTSKDTFVTIFLNILRDLGEHRTEVEKRSLREAGFQVGSDNLAKGTGTVSGERAYAPIAPEALDQASVLRRLESVQDRVDALVFDEFQQLKDTDIRPQMYDLVKALSDNLIKVRIFFVGIADSDEAIFPPSSDYAEYKLRHYRAVKIPRMSASELEDILDRRAEIFNVHFDPAVKRKMVDIANGYPSYVHKLALMTCRTWITRHRTELANILKGYSWWGTKISLVRLGWHAVKRIKVETLDIRAESDHFLIGLVEFLEEFFHSYGEQAIRFRSDVIDSDSAVPYKLYVLLANTEAGASSSELAEELRVEQPHVLAVLQKLQATQPSGRGLKPLVIHDSETKKWRLIHPHVGTIIKAYDHLRRNREQLAKLLEPEPKNRDMTFREALAKTFGSDPRQLSRQQTFLVNWIMGNNSD